MGQVFRNSERTWPGSLKVRQASKELKTFFGKRNGEIAW